uniref:Putative secreted protein n=1 Tax=Amblyomma sculptum TaxID=1581419 RepID=A0A1E1XT64_AMBSC
MFIFLVLLALTTTLDAAVVQEAGGIEGEKIRKDMNPAALAKAGKTVETLGKILQGDVSLNTAEELDSVLDAINALSVTGEETDELSLIMLIVKAIAIGAATGAASAGIKHAVEKAAAKREG